ncbi:DUF6990 domain-containing protein [Bartonella henselae]
MLHLGSLSLLGDVETLHSYQQSFAVRDHLGFDEHIQQIYLERYS